MKKEDRTNYYCFLVSLIGSKTVSTKEMYQLIDMADKHFSITRGINKDRHRVITQDLVKVLGDYMSSMEDTETKVRGRGKAMYYSIDKSLEEVCTRITKYYGSCLAKDKKVVVEPKPVPVEKVEEKPEIRKKRLPNKKILLKVYRVVKRGLKAPLGYISFEDLKKEGGTKIKWNYWVSSLKDSGLIIPYTFEKGGILIGNVSDTIYSLTRKAKEWYGIELDTEKRSVGLGIGMFAESMQLNPSLPRPVITTVKKPIKVIDQPTHRSSIPQDKRDYVIYLISALIRRGGGRAVEIDTIGKFIRDNLGYTGVMKNDILDLIKEEGELTLVRSNSAISLRDPEKSWEVLKEKYSPSDCILVHARLGFNEEELKTFGFIGIEVESRISERDNIFAISIRRNSRKDFRKLVTLYQSFRGNDCILGNKSLVESLKTQAIEDQKFVKNNDPIYQLEKI